MSAGVVAMILTAVCAAGAAPTPDVALSNDVPVEYQANPLPPAPKKVVLETSYFGNVTVDHEAHLKRGFHCTACHDPGRVKKIAFTPKIAHDRCRGCHVELAKGPTDCRSCHVLPPPPQPTAVAAAPAPGGIAAPPGPPPAPRSSYLALAPSELESAHPGFRRNLQVGAAAGTVYGLSARLVSRQGPWVMSHDLSRLSSSGPTRTLLLVGGGSNLPIPVPRLVELSAEGVAGFDVLERPSVLLRPAVGARVAAEWTPPLLGRFPLHVALTGLVDLFQGGLSSGGYLFASIGVGTPIPR
jgi:hypothetical protein